VTPLDTIIKELGSHRRSWGAGLKPVWAAADPEDQPKERDKKKQFLKRICVG
jgi:hypothetical protein